MRRSLVSIPLVAFSLSFVALGGCGDDSKVGTIQDSPEAKKADASAQKGMEDFMKSKKQTKSVKK